MTGYSRCGVRKMSRLGRRHLNPPLNDRKEKREKKLALRKLGKSIADNGNYKQRPQPGTNLMQDCSQVNLLSCVYLPSLAQKTTNNSVVYQIWLQPLYQLLQPFIIEPQVASQFYAG